MHVPWRLKINLTFSVFCYGLVYLSSHHLNEEVPHKNLLGEVCSNAMIGRRCFARFRYLKPASGNKNHVSWQAWRQIWNKLSKNVLYQHFEATYTHNSMQHERYFRRSALTCIREQWRVLKFAVQQFHHFLPSQHWNLSCNSSLRRAQQT